MDDRREFGREVVLIVQAVTAECAPEVALWCHLNDGFPDEVTLAGSVVTIRYPKALLRPLAERVWERVVEALQRADLEVRIAPEADGLSAIDAALDASGLAGSETPDDEPPAGDGG